jgi:hypothetical protein
MLAVSLKINLFHDNSNILWRFSRHQPFGKTSDHVEKSLGVMRTPHLPNSPSNDDPQ